MEHINRGIICHDLFHVDKSIEQELVELIAGHVVVFNLASSAFIIDVVRRISQDQVCFLPLHQYFISLLFGRVPADQAVPAQCPHVTHLSYGRLFQLTIHIKVIIFHFGIFLEEICQLLFIEASQGQIKSLCLQRFNLNAQQLLVPAGIHRHTVISNDVGFLLSFGQMIRKHARDLFDALFLCRKNTTVAGDHTIVTVDDDRIDKTKLAQGGPELVDLFR